MGRGFKFAFGRLLVSIILGFLPSFLFIALLTQYGSPISNYINFLSNFNVSRLAWISALGISAIIFLIWSIIKSKISSKKYLLLLIFVFLFIGLALVFAQIYLYINFLLGQDILVRLSADKENIFFTGNYSERVSFKTTIVMNPFCTASCYYEFFDVSKGEVIEGGEFDIASVLPNIKTYSLEKDELVSGQILKSFKVRCMSKKTYFCYTNGEESQRTALITINYGISQEDMALSESLKSELLDLGSEFYNSEIILDEINLNLDAMNRSIYVDNLLYSLNNLSNYSAELNSSFESLKTLWEKQDILSLQTGIESFRKNLGIFKSGEASLNLEAKSDFSSYNLLIENLNGSGVLLKEAVLKNFTESDCNELNEVVNSFNLALDEFKIRAEINSKTNLVNDICSRIKTISEKSKENLGNLCPLSENIKEKGIEKISWVEIDNETIPAVLLKEKVPVCCYYGKCISCCDLSCSDRNYPVIFLHGHSISRTTPADYSFDSLVKIKEKLVSSGYVDAGAITVSPIKEEGGLWGKVDMPFAITASYFFDTYKNADGEFSTISSKTDSIDTYALRLKDIVELAKYKTGKQKVIIIAHSMGGLVTRRYVQIFGAENIDKIILITAPNHGIDNKVREYCGIIGSSVACSNMDEDSLFINKLNYAPTEKPEIHNIIGIGCNIEDETGDGIVKNSSQYLDYAHNYYVAGSCDELNFKYLHEEIVNPVMYPEVYEIIKRILNDES
ncbi:MAG: alpha/beta fold hydrolase [Candidatus Pacearchaeota archaeon]